ncbi:hypothetical protein [Pseudonocardia spinosispora]|uniref:hypothetical protein n=1 Tax=Pseudonocardia spinosispora TaxID=103441 RepID=UPI00048D68C3|nr:hypothetical protein [Pseudonocardia spinosispora]
MLFQQRFWSGIRDGSVTVAYRRWDQERVVAGRRHRVAGGMIEIDDIREVDEASITDADAVRAGYPDARSCREDLRGDADRLFRITFHDTGEDPRTALAADGELSDQQRAELDRRLARLDAASTHGPWTAATLDLIAARPGVRAGDLAAELGREREPFKIDVRKLKNLGLTLSLEVGYRLSPRGEAYRAR